MPERNVVIANWPQVPVCIKNLSDLSESQIWFNEEMKMKSIDLNLSRYGALDKCFTCRGYYQTPLLPLMSNLLDDNRLQHRSLIESGTSLPTQTRVSCTSTTGVATILVFVGQLVCLLLLVLVLTVKY